MAVDPIIKQKANNIRTKTYGKDVRESLASGLEAVSTDVVDVKGRQLSVESQFQDVIDETTGKDVISAPEITAARNGETNLATRLDKEREQLTAQLIRTEQQLSREAIKSVVSFIADDSPMEDYTKLFPITQQTGCPFSIAVIAEPGRALFGDLPKLHDLVDNYGWEVMSHTVNHVWLGNSSYEVQENEMRQSKANLEAEGFEVRGIVYPYGSINDDTLEIASRYYENGYLAATNKLNDSPLNTYQIERIAFDPTNANNNLAWYKSKVDEAIAGDKWIIFMLHSKVSWGGYDDWLDASQQQMLLELVLYIQSKNIEILTASDAFDRFKNVYETKDGRYKIGAKTNMGYTILSGRPDIIQSASINVFPRGESIKVFAFSDGQNFPESPAGTLRTVNFGAIEQSYQEWNPHDSKRTYARNVQANGTWGEFTNRSDFTVLRSGPTIGADTLIGAFPRGESIKVFTLGDNQNFPDSPAGALRTVSFGAIEQSHQEWRPFEYSRIYWRRVNADGSWGNFLQLNHGRGTSAQRPANAHVGYPYFDTTLGKPVWLKGVAPVTWVDATGNTV